MLLLTYLEILQKNDMLDVQLIVPNYLNKEFYNKWIDRKRLVFTHLKTKIVHIVNSSLRNTKKFHL